MQDSGTIAATDPQEPADLLRMALAVSQKVVLVIDVVESVRLMAGDERGTVARWHNFVQAAQQQTIPQHKGRLVKSLGDGLMVEFENSRDATTAAQAFHTTISTSNAGLPPERQMHLRAGINDTQVYTSQMDIFGAGVNLAARLATLAGPGETVVSASVRDGLIDGLDASIEDLGECYLKHIEEPVRVYRVGGVGAAPVLMAQSENSARLQPTIAILPTLGGLGTSDTACEAEIFAEELIVRLARSPDLRVISRLSTSSLSHRHLPLAQAQTLLGADYLVQSRVSDVGGRKRVFAELVESRSGTVIWAHSGTSAMGPSWCFDDMLIEELAQSVLNKISSEELRKSLAQPYPTLASYSLMIGAVSLMHRASKRDFEMAHGMLNHLLERHPRLSSTHAWMANWHALRVTQGHTSNPEQDSAIALDHTARALDRNPNCSLALAIDGVLHANLRKDMATAIHRLDSALSVNPSESLAWLFKAGVHAFVGEGELAESASERALALSPLHPIQYYYESFAATASLSAKNYERAIHYAQRSVRANRTHPSSFRVLAIAQSLSGATDEACTTINALRTLLPGYTVAQFRANSPYAAGPLGEEFAKALVAAGLP